MSSRNFKKNLQNESREKVLSKICDFIDQFSLNDLISKEENLQDFKTLNLEKNLSFIDDYVEHTEILDLIETSGNIKLNGVLTVIYELIEQFNELSLKIDENFIIPLSIYDQNLNSNLKNNFYKISDLIPKFFDLVCYLKRCFDLSENFILQLINLYDQNNDKNNIKFKNTRFDQVFDSFLTILTSIISIEEVLRNNHKLKKEYFEYKQMVEFIALNNEKFNTTNEKKKKIDFFLLMISKIENELFENSFLFRNFYVSLSRRFESNEKLKNNLNLDKIFLNYIKYKLTEFECSKYFLPNQWLGMCSLFIIYHHLFKKEDKKLAKLILETQKRLEIYTIHLGCNIYIIPDKFLYLNLSEIFSDKKLFDFLNQQRDQLIYQSKLHEIFNNIEKKIISWFLKFNYLTTKKPRIEQDIIDHFISQAKILEQGFILLNSCISIAKTYLFLYPYLNKTISKNELIIICKLINFTKAIQIAYLRKKSSIMLILSRYLEYCSFTILKNLNKIILNLKNNSEVSSKRKVELISVINLINNCLNGPLLTNKRQFIASFCISVLNCSVTDQELTEIKINLRRIIFLKNLYTLISKNSNCDFLYFHNMIIETFFNFCSEQNQNLSSEMIYFFYSLNDCFELTSKNSIETSKLFENYLMKTFKNNFLERLSIQYEDELRFQIHQEIQLVDSSPFKRKLCSFLLFFNLGVIPFYDKFISIKSYLQNHLNKVSYCLTSIALHDWKTYEVMLNLSRNREGTNFVFSQLPTQTLEQGLDFIELSRNIQNFVFSFNYNLNNQMFIEKSNNDRYLNVLKIKHVSNSIRTHGFAVLNTAVNHVYKFLKTKFVIFSKFLFQENIKSKLQKEIRNYKKTEYQKYSFENANKLLRNLKNFGYIQDGRTYVDEFESLITQIGNVLAFVKLLRSGALHCSANSLKFIPDLEELNELNFEKLASNCSLTSKTIEASKILDENLNLFKQNFTESKDYFKMIVQTFEKSINKSNNLHLNNFYMILPALTINYIENMILSKEKINKKSETGATFTNDGFAMGIAYILRLLDQGKVFENIQWFNVVNNDIKEKIILLETEAKQKRNLHDEKLIQTNTLTTKNLQTLLTEFSLLEYNLGSCMILFRKME